MRRNIDKIEIQEPPMQEFKKQRSCLKRACFTSCGCLVFFLIGALLILKFTSGPRVKELKSTPPNFPADITIYDKDDISKITVISGEERGRALETIAYVPKLILSPIFLVLEKKFPVRKENPEGRIEQKTTWESFVSLMKEPVADHRDKAQIEWTELPAESRFVYNYYKDELEKAGFAINEASDKDNVRQFAFSLDDTEGVLYITDDAQKPGTDFVSLTVNIGSAN